MTLLFLDSESVGLCGEIKLIQFSVGESGPVEFIRFDQPPDFNQLIRLFNMLYDSSVTLVAYNLAHDAKFLYKTFHHYLFGEAYDSPRRPVDPFLCQTLDLYVAATQKSPLAPFAFGKGASKSVAAVRKIPVAAYDIVGSRVEDALRPHLPRSVQLIRHRREVKDRPDLTTICWTLDGRLSLKNLMNEYGIATQKIENVWPLPPKDSEKPWLPYPTPEVHDPVEVLCNEVMANPHAPFWKYAEDDIHYLRILYEKLGRPAPDHHSTCTAVVAYTYYYGFPLDRAVLLRTKEVYEKKIRAAEQALAGTNLGSAKQRLALLRKFDPLVGSSKKAVIQILADSDRPSAPTARAMLDFGMYKQRLLQVEKVLESRTGRAHPSLRVMGTRTGRMAGEAGLNWQGICAAKKGIGIRAALGASAVGDWSAFEVVLGANIYQDEAMFEDIEKGIDPHSMNASLMHPKALKNGWTYEFIKAKVDAGDPDMIAFRKANKGTSFCTQYFGAAPKLAEILGCSVEEGEAALSRFYLRYQGFALYRKQLEQRYLTADTERWDKHSVARMACSVTDETGWEMRWDFEKVVASVLWELGGTGIRTGVPGSVVRVKEKGIQTVDGSVKSALLGGAIAIQQAVMRQAGNALVQGSGASLCKALQAETWKRYHTPCLNIHDELIFSPHPHFNYARICAVVDEFVERWESKLRLLHFDFKETRTWADK